MISSLAKKRALNNLINIDGVRAPREYPHGIVLPESIHTKTLSALGMTAVEGREYSINFWYAFGRWFGGKAVAGTVLEQSEEPLEWIAHTSTSKLDYLGPRPHLQVHTHPEITKEFTDASVRSDFDVSGLSDQELEELIETSLLFNSSIARVPSNVDITGALYFPNKNIGQMVASIGGNFLSLKKLDNPLSRSPFNTKSAIAAHQRLEELDRQHRRLREELGNIAIEDLRTRLLEGAATALYPQFISYYNPDPENPNLERVL